MIDRRVLLAAVCAVASACETAQPADVPPSLDVAFVVSDTATVPRLSLSTSPNAVATHPGGSNLIQDLEIRSDGIGQLADVTTGPSGEILLLDRINSTVEVYDSTGTLLRHVGRDGPGPGEFSSPIAIDADENVIAVLDSNPAKALTLLDWGGRAIEAAAGPQSDWVNISTRGPRTRMTAPLQGGPEDWSRRLTAAGDSQFILHARWSDHHVARELGAPGEGWLIRFGPGLVAMDTIARVAVPETPVSTIAATVRATGERVARSSDERMEEIFASRPVFAGGAGWRAIGHGSDNGMVVQYAAGDTTLILDWPSGSRAITSTDREAAVLREIEATNQLDVRAAERWNDLGDRERSAWIRRGVDLWPFASRAPEIVAAYGRGACLWLAGFDPEASLDATAAHLLAVRIVPPYAVATFRLPRPELRLRHIAEDAVYASYKDDSAVDRLVRLRFNEIDCDVRERNHP